MKFLKFPIVLLFLFFAVIELIGMVSSFPSIHFNNAGGLFPWFLYPVLAGIYFWAAYYSWKKL